MKSISQRWFSSVTAVRLLRTTALFRRVRRRRAEVRFAVKRVLYRRGVRPEDLDALLEAVMRQAEAIHSQWPQAA